MALGEEDSELGQDCSTGCLFGDPCVQYLSIHDITEHVQVVADVYGWASPLMTPTETRVAGICSLLVSFSKKGVTNNMTDQRCQWDAVRLELLVWLADVLHIAKKP